MTEKSSMLYRVSESTDSRSVARELNFILSRIADRLDKIEGLRGTPTFYKSTFDFQTDESLTVGDALVATSDTEAEMGAVNVSSTTASTFTIDSDGNPMVLTPGANTFNITTGTASLDVAAGKTVNVDDNVTVSAELHVEAATHVNQDLTSDAGPTFDHIHVPGVFFPASQSASADANCLDDYEENTWTPQVQFGGAGVGVTYTTQSGTYTKIGRVVIASCFIVMTSNGSSTGDAAIAGLPFTVGAHAAASVAYVQNITYTGVIHAYAQSGNTAIMLLQTTEAGTLTALSQANIPDNGIIMVQVTYNV